MSIHRCINMDMASQLAFSPLLLGVPHTSASPAAFVRHDTFPDPEIYNCQQVPKSGEDRQPRENRSRRRRTRGRSPPFAGFFCPIPSCCRNQGTLRKPFGRTDNLKTHLKTVHNLPITDGVRVPKWITENSGEVDEAEDRARACLSLKY